MLQHFKLVMLHENKLKGKGCQEGPLHMVLITPMSGRTEINRRGLFADKHNFLKFAKRERTGHTDLDTRNINSLTERLLQ